MNQKKVLIKAGCRAIDDAFNPYDKGIWTLLISNSSISNAPKLGKAYLFSLSECLPLTIRQPICVYKGLKRIDEDQGLAYVAQPPFKHINGQKVPVKTTEVFFVFANEDRIMFEWGWEELNLNNVLNLHIGDDARFEERIH